MGSGLDRHWIEHRFADFTPAPLGADEGIDDLREAAVLVPLVERDSGIRVVLTRRTHTLRDHAGQISFPGGRIEASDTDPVEAALRETEEEIGVPRDRVALIGELPSLPTATGYLIHPVVGFLDPSVRFRAQPSEVAEIFEVPLSFVLDTGNHRPHTIARDGRRYRLHAIPYRDYFIWGATAGMLRSLVQLLTRRGVTTTDLD
jgi:8-oxo-dGTP pyrophosphatase MutT (NUDIX family)